MAHVGGNLDWNGDIEGADTSCNGDKTAHSGQGNILTLHDFAISWSKRNDMMYALIGREMGISEGTLVHAGSAYNYVTSRRGDSPEAVEAYNAGFDLFNGATLESVMKSRGLKMQASWPDSWDQLVWPSEETSSEQLTRKADAQLQAMIQ